MRMKLSERCVDGRSMPRTPSTARVYGILVLEVLEELNPEIVHLQGVPTAVYARSPEVSAVVNLEILRVLMDYNPKYCEYTRYLK